VGRRIKEREKERKMHNRGDIVWSFTKNNIKTVFLALQDEASIQYVAFMNYWTAIHVSSTVVLDV
jgi:hypothetical protein